MIAGLLILGLMLIATALKGTEHELAQELQMDLFGAGGFVIWIVAILLLAGVGYIPGLHDLSRLFMVLLLVVIFLGNAGVFAQFQKALQGVSAAGPAPSNPVPGIPSSTGAGAAGGTAGAAGGPGIGQAVGTAAAGAAAGAAVSQLAPLLLALL